MLLIPRYSYFGAAWVTVISDVVGFLIFFVVIRKNFLIGKPTYEKV